MKNRKMKRIALISTILAVLLLITGCSFASPAKNTPIPENVEFTGEVQVSDEDTLRKALKSKEDSTVILSGDIVITEELTVNGNKKISGGSIIMDRRRVGANESVLAVSKGAYLVMDGTTVDGNGIADCVTVKAGGCFESVSGSLIYGYPYGLDVSGTVKINDIHIDEALHTAINVAIFGEVDMLGGSITNNLYGISVAEDARMDMADGIIMDNSFASFIINYGDMDIAGGKYIGSHDNAIENWGKMSIKGTEDKPIEIADCTKSGINSKNKATIDAEYIVIRNMGWHAMCVEKGADAKLKNITMDVSGKSTLYVNSAKAVLENVTVSGGTSYGIYATQKADVEMYDVVVKDVADRGITNERSTIKIDGLVVENTKKNGFYSASDSSVSHISNAEFYNVGASAIGVAKGKVDARSIYVSGTKKEGLSVAATGTLTVECSTIMNNGNFAIANYGGKVTAKCVNIYNTENVSVKLMDGCTFYGDELTIVNSYKQAISVEGGSTANVTDSYISGTKMAGINVDNSYLKLTDSTIKNTGSYGLATQKDGKAILDNIEVYDTGSHGIGSLNSYVVAGNIKVYNSGRAGVYSEGANARINMNQVEIYNAGTCGFGFKGASEITARNVTIENPTNEGIYALAAANVKKLDNIVIKNPGSHGISVEGNAIINVTVDTKFNPENTTGNGVTIINAGTNGLRAKDGTLTATGVTINGTKQHGIAAGENGIITVKNCTIEDPVQHGINISAGGTVKVSETTITNAGNRGVASAGKLTVDGLTIDTTQNHGIYLGAAATLEGSGLTIQNVGSNGIFSEGANITVDGLTVANTATQGIQLKGGTVKLSNIDIRETTNAAVYIRNSTKLTLENGVISAYGVGLATTDSAEATAKNITIERGAKNGKDGTGLLAQADSSSKIELDGTKLDGKGKTDVGVKVVTDKATVILNGATFTGNTTDVELGKNGAAISLKSALTETLTVKPASYEGGTLIAKDAGVGETGFKASTKKIDVRNETSYVGEDGYLVATAALLNGVGYGSLQAAIDAAEDDDTIKILAEASTITKTVTKGVKLTADTAVTITVDSALSAEAFKVASGKILTVEGTGSGKITIESASTGKEVFYNQGTVNLTNVAVSGGKYAVNNRADATLNMTNVTVANTADNGLHLAGGTTTVTNVTISNTKGHGIGSYGNLVLKPAAEGQIALTINTTGTSSAKKHGIYASYDSVITGSGLSIMNTTNAGFFGDRDATKSTVGINVNLADVTVENTGAQGIQAKLGTVTITDFTINGTGSAALRPYEGFGVKFNLSNGTISTGTYGIAMDNNKQEAVLTNVTIERTGTKTDPVVNVAGTAKLELAGTTKVDGKNSGAVGVKVAASGATVTMSGATITGTNTDVELVSGAKITVNSALSSAVSVKMAAYAEGTVVAVKGSGISDADFKDSMAKLQPVQEDPKMEVDENGKLAFADHTHNYVGVVTKNATCTEAGEKTYTCDICSDSYIEPISALGHTVVHVATKNPTLEAEGNIEHWYCSVCSTYWNDAENKNVIDQEDVTLPVVAAGNVAYMNGTAYATLEAAVGAANAGDTIHLLANATVTEQIKPAVSLTIKAAQPVTITANVAQAFYVESGKTLNMEGTGSGKITVTSTLTGSNQEVFYNAGNLNLTNVAVSGGHRAVNNRDNANLNLTNVTITNTADNGLHLAGGTTTVTNVTISAVKGHGIGCYGNLVLKPASEGAYALTINTTGTSSAKKHGIYASYNATITGSGLRIQNTTNAGFFGDRDATKSTVGVTLNLTNVTVENTGAQGIQAKKGTITISNFSITGTGSAALRPYDNYGVTFTLSNGTVTTGTYGLAMDKATQAAVFTNVTFNRTGTKTDAVLSVTTNATLTATDVTVNIPSQFNALSINGATSFEGITVIAAE